MKLNYLSERFSSLISISIHFIILIAFIYPGKKLQFSMQLVFVVVQQNQHYQRHKLFINDMRLIVTRLCFKYMSYQHYYIMHMCIDFREI